MAEEQPVPQEAILDLLKTRGFETGFQATPLREFQGKLDSITGTMRQGNRGPYLVVLYNFSGLEVIASLEPYPSPIGQIEIPQSTKEGTKMGYFGDSVDKLLNAGVAKDDESTPTRGQGYLIGKTLHMKLTPGHMIRGKDGDNWVDKPTDCWTLMGVVGEGVSVAPAVAGAPAPVATPVAAGPSATQEALRLLNGKTEQAWHQEVFSNTIVKANNDVVSAIIGRTFLEPMILAGQVTKDEATGIFTVV